MKTIKLFIIFSITALYLMSFPAFAQEKPDSSNMNHQMMMKHDHQMMHDSSSRHNMHGMNMSKDSSKHKMNNAMISSKKSPLISLTSAGIILPGVRICTTWQPHGWREGTARSLPWFFTVPVKVTMESLKGSGIDAVQISSPARPPRMGRTRRVGTIWLASASPGAASVTTRT